MRGWGSMYHLYNNMLKVIGIAPWTHLIRTLPRACYPHFPEENRYLESQMASSHPRRQKNQIFFLVSSIKSTIHRFNEMIRLANTKILQLRRARWYRRRLDTRFLQSDGLFIIEGARWVVNSTDVLLWSLFNMATIMGSIFHGWAMSHWENNDRIELLRCLVSNFIRHLHPTYQIRLFIPSVECTYHYAWQSFDLCCVMAKTGKDSFLPTKVGISPIKILTKV